MPRQGHHMPNFVQIYSQLWSHIKNKEETDTQTDIQTYSRLYIYVRFIRININEI